MNENEIGKRLLDVAFEVHRELGPGLLETVYETILAAELIGLGVSVDRQVPIDIEYKGMSFKEAFRADLVIERKVIVELKCVEKLNSSHKKQLLTYLRLTGMRLGFILNFNVALLKDGIVRTANGFENN